MQGLKLGATVAALLAMSAPAFAETTVLQNVTVIDGTGAAAKPNSAIVMWDPLESTCRHASLSIL